jgi:tetratricopeptide (TPR) repeat protein
MDQSRERLLMTLPAGVQVQPPDDCVTALLRESQERVRHGDIAGALQALDEALELNPRSAWAWAHRGDILCQHLGRYQEAIVDFDRALTIQPEYVWALAHRGAAHERLDAFDKAEADLVRALALKPEYTWVIAMLARVYQFTGRLEQALDAVEQVVARDPPLLTYWREERAMARMQVGRYEEAQHYFRIALEANPEDRFAMYNSTVNLVRWHGLAEARPAIDRLRARLESVLVTVSDDREIDRSVYELGGLFAMEGEIERALAQLEEAIDRERGKVLLSPARKRARVDLAWSGLREQSRFRALTGYRQFHQGG